MGKRLYVISGVAGMTGSECAYQILKTGDTIIGFDNFFASSINTIKDIINNKRFIFYEYDLNNYQQMELVKRRVLSLKHDFNEIVYINCAAIVHTEYFYHIDLTFETNVLSMKNFLEQSISVGAQKFINCSTSEVYSMQSWVSGGVKENDYLVLATAEHSQRTSYAMGKLITEFFLKDMVNKNLIKGCSIRFANVYSKNELFPKHIIPHIIISLLKNKSVVLLENSRFNKRTFLHNIDSCSAILSLVKVSQIDQVLDGSAYNVATNEEISIIDLVYMIAARLNIRDPKIIFEGYRINDPERRLLNIDKICKNTKWCPSITLSVGIDMCIEYLRGAV